MENEDIIQSPDDSLNQSIQEQTLSTPLPVTQDLVSFDIQSPDDSMIQSVEETQPYLSQQNFLEFEDIKGVIKSFLYPEETPKALTEVVSKPMKYGLFFDTANEFLEENKKQRAEEKFASEPNVIKVNSTTYIDTTTGKNLYASFGKNEIVDQALSGL